MGQGFLHWSANFNEVQDFEAQIRTLAGGTGLMTDAQFNTGTRSQPLGDNKAGVSSDLDALGAYLTSLNIFPSSPSRNADGSLTPTAAVGKTVFQTQGCVLCHGGPGFTVSSDGSALKNVGTLKPSSGARLGSTLTGIDIPTLRDVWATAPYLHDGSAATVSDAIAAHNVANLTPADLANASEYVLEIGGEESVAGLTPGTQCAGENGTCTLPAGITATVNYGAAASYAQKVGVTLSIGCNNATFGDPLSGTQKACYYVRTDNPAAPPVVPTVTLRATPPSVTSGAASTLTWSSTNATTCSATGGWTGSKAVSGTAATPALAATTAYTLTCAGSGGISASAVATVTVTALPPPTVTLNATPAGIASGATSTLTWSSVNATACSATGGWTGTKGVSGTVATAPLTATTTYTLTCTGSSGTSASATATVTVTAASTPTATLSATPASVASGSTSTLTWSSSNATACTAAGGWAGAKNLSGSAVTAPLTVTTTYTLACTGSSGTSASAGATVTVTATPAPTVTLSATPASIASGATSTLTWSSGNATACTASGGWVGARPSSGTFTTSALTASSSYTLVCSGPGGSSAPSTVTVTVAGSVGTLCASENGVCFLPASSSATISYGANGVYNTKSAVTGSIACTNGNFGDPIPYVGKSCYYLVTSVVTEGGTGSGLQGNYYAANDLSGPAVLTRTEAINFNWGNDAPAPNLPADNFSIRWTGFLEAPTTGTYTLKTNSDDGVRIWVNGVQIINDWTPHAATADTSAAFTAAAGQRLSISVEYQELGGAALMQMAWQKPGDAGFAVVPVSRLYAQ